MLVRQELNVPGRMDRDISFVPVIKIEIELRVHSGFKYSLGARENCSS
jgi:hypothetical protein